MEMLEIVLLFAGGIIFILSFFIPDKKRETAGQTKAVAKEEISELVSKELQSVRSHVDDVVEESVTYAMEKTERALERLSNEKIMAVSEYSDTVLSEIHKNHEEAMFLYDMLNNKHVNLKNTVSEVNRTVKEAEETVTSFKKLTPDVVKQEGQSVPDVSVTQEPPAMSALDRLRRNEPEEAAEKTQQERFLGKDAVAFGEGSRETGDPVFEPGLQQMYGSAADGQEENTVGEWETSDSAGLSEEESGGRNSNERILELYAQGKSKVEIAKELGLGVGEVKLVIDLYRNQRK